jgi:outer membrane immunogenic protein
MQKILLSAAFAAIAGQAYASDLPSTKAPPPPPVLIAAPVAFSWTGFYGGIEGGVDFTQTTGALNNTALGTTAPYNVRSTGVPLGGMVGYNKQIGALVLGVEANADGIIDGRRTVSPSDALGNPYRVTALNTYDADLRGRVGFAIDRALLFAAGGVAFGNVNTSYSGAALPGAASFNSERVGWTAGGGMEYAITNNVIGRAEYRFTDFGSASYTNVATSVSDKTRYESNAALLGLMYKFGSP